MDTTDYIFIDFPIRNYLYDTNVKELYIRKPLSKPLRFLRKLPVFSLFISNTKEKKEWTKNVKVPRISYCLTPMPTMLTIAKK